MTIETTQFPARAATTFRISTPGRRDRICRTFERLDDPGIVVAPVSADDSLDVVITCTTASTESRARRVVVLLDPAAVRVGPDRRTVTMYAQETPDVAHLFGLPLPRTEQVLAAARRLLASARP